MYSKQPPALDSVGVCSIFLPGMSMLVVRSGYCFYDPSSRYGNDVS